ncbi:universal stress protein [Yinghuangia seranimata]|uniref:universal stress protein n=1 Tax=Yinghuangia seranimata TaxID=408067 RepID=UPI00248BDB00|nr:universal stress protein [Yinghuangia seranimata]MDI2124759.1 universal stress protein [Yinghuangia seranimata]
MPTGSAGRRAVAVGVERTKAGRLAVLWAADEAARRGVPLRLVRALGTPAVVPRARSAYAKAEHLHAAAALASTYRDPDLIPRAHGWGDEYREAAAAALEDARALAVGRQPRLDVAGTLEDGEPVAVLRAAAEDAALLVLGSRRLSSAAELSATGGIAVPVLERARCPVAIVRGEEHHADTGAFLVVAVDGTPLSGPAVRYAFETAAARGVLLEAVHVTQTSGHTAREDAAARFRLAEALEERLAAHPDVVVRPRVVHGPAVHALVAASRRALALVVGSRGMGGVEGMVRGSVSHGLIHHVTCPLVVVPGGPPGSRAVR